MERTLADVVARTHVVILSVRAWSLILLLKGTDADNRIGGMVGSSGPTIAAPMILLRPVYVMVVGILVGPVAWRWRQRAAWQAWEFLSGLTPLLLWFGLLISDCCRRKKSLANLVGEPLFIALVVAVIAWCRVALAPKVDSTRAAICAALLALTAAWFVWRFVPLLPE